MSLFNKRQGEMVAHELYFYTVTINQFQNLLANDEIKMIVMNSLRYLVSNRLAVVYGFVIMPNHLHLIWKIMETDRKETVVGSFLKFTAHSFQKYLRLHSPTLLLDYRVSLRDRKYKFWKRDALAIPIDNLKILEQKLDYIHTNPLQDKWKLVGVPEDYKWSSARFYFNGLDEFHILTHYRD